MKNQRIAPFTPRQYMVSRDYEIYYYSDLHFQSVGRHSHDYYEFYFFVEGDVSMEIRADRTPLCPGDVLIVPPDIPHQALVKESDIPYRRFVFWLSRDYMSALTAQSSDYAYLIQEAEQGRYLYHFDRLTFNTLRAALFELLDELHADRYGKETQISLGIGRLLLQMNRLVYEQTHSASPQEALSQYELITAFIHTHLEEDLSLDRLAQELFLSKYYIAHLFQESIGLSVHQYITKQRLSACAAAIRDGGKITEVYHQFGFRDYSAFYRAFLKEFRMSPATYRELMLPEKESF